MTAEPAAHLAAATQRRLTDTRARVRAALQRLDSEGSMINYGTVANAASVSRSLLYRDPELRKEIHRLRGITPSTSPTPPVSQRMTQASREELIHTLRSELRTLRHENQALRDRLATVLGKERATQQQATPTTHPDQETTVNHMSLTHQS